MLELSGAARLKRLLMAMTVVLGSGGVGYFASRIWPLPKRAAPVAHSLTATEPTADAQPAAPQQDMAPKPAPQVGGWVGVADPGAAPAPQQRTAEPERGPTADTPPPAIDPVPKQAAIEPRPTPVEASANVPSAADAKPAAPAKEERAAVPARQRPPRAKARVIRRQQAVGGGGGGGGSSVEFAPNPAPNQAARDFMARPSAY
jgi:hypothetical protein